MQMGNVSDIDKKLNYELVRQIEEHAKKYDTAFDKKRFLKNVSPYEQKYILVNSSNPFEVLMYLDEIDSKDTRLLLSELNQDEIVNIINLLSCEQKKVFYNSFTNLELVNKFIKYDKNAKEHIQDLEFERKVEIIDASNKETIEASSAVYESMGEIEKQLVPDMITDVDAIVALESTEAYQIADAEQSATTIQSEAPQTEATNPILAPMEDLTQEFKKQEDTKENKQEIKPGEEKEKIVELLEALDEQKEQVTNSIEPDVSIEDTNSINTIEPNEAIVDPKLTNSIEPGAPSEDIKSTQDLDAMSASTESAVVKEFNDAKNMCEQDIIDQIQANFQNAITAHAIKK